MKIIADSFFSIGRTHQVCEDYCISGELPNPYVILADGCSSSENTDVGARLLVHMLREKLPYFLDDYGNMANGLASFVIHEVEMLRSLLGLNPDSIDASLGYIYYSNNSLFSKICGDGISILGLSGVDEKLTIVAYDHITYEYEMPYYLSYLSNEKRHNIYKQINPKRHIHHLSCFCKGEVIEEFSGSGHFSGLFEKHTTGIYAKHDEANKIKFAMIASDGLSSFKNIKTSEDIPLQEIVKRFTNFKVTKGEFVKRTARRALKDLAKEDVYPMDDISLGCLMINREEDNGNIS